MPRQADEYAIFFLIEGGHREEVRFSDIKEFQKWYSSVLIPKAEADDFINVPIKNMQGEFMVVRPSSIKAIRVEPVFLGSIERF
ncbi:MULTISPECIES: hypothetical protein [Cyanophyceae]|uniref:hypothetical protein n=1 Tax=Cyanophyceae TaxID=3028117 RepID=UPI00016DCC6D|nr:MULTISPECIES: hypothetical protein [Cyanophyceae]ACB00070.1 conserved hypothetical protein [Picosynechococcus sp. PCC 7002]AMA09708.1 hypothetical protein AWQ23_10450 [Picosynechococcus sp. PCC 73109]ANV87869.1 hypothetical protein AWQ22_10570 [Picosynechococcus sp. PCC 7117]ANV91063.1 hypothetical protein AWQ24_10675 [Picosynechococcus sp. PCC 8807]QCS50573.1 hypothetical protein FEK30_14700 [Picosynechococcus sp. PCC 11901]